MIMVRLFIRMEITRFETVVVLFVCLFLGLYALLLLIPNLLHNLCSGI